MGCVISKEVVKRSYVDNPPNNNDNQMVSKQNKFIQNQKALIPNEKNQQMKDKKQKPEGIEIVSGIQNQEVIVEEENKQEQQLYQNNKITDSQYQQYLDNMNYLQKNAQQQQQQQHVINKPQIPQVQCQIHPENLIAAINVNPESQQKLCCLECILKNNYPANEIIQIKDIFNQTKQVFVNNWAFFKNQKNKFILQNIYSNQAENSIFQHLKQTLFSFKDMINKQIDNYTISLDACIKTLDEQKQKLKSKFEQSNFQELMRDLLSENNNEKPITNDQITDILKNQQQETKVMEDLLHKYSKVQSKEIGKQASLMKLFNEDLLQFLSQKDLFKFSIPVELQKELEKWQIKLDREVPLKQDLIKKSNKFANQLQVKLNESSELDLISVDNYQKQYFLNFELKQQDKYQFTFKTSKTQPDEYMFIGLLPGSKIDTAFVVEYKWYIPIRYNPTDTYGFNIDKGVCINNDRSNTKEIKLQICLNENIFRWKFGSNVNSYHSWNNFFRQEQHFLMFYLEDINQKLTIKNIKKVQYFEEW